MDTGKLQSAAHLLLVGFWLFGALAVDDLVYLYVILLEHNVRMATQFHVLRKSSCTNAATGSALVEGPTPQGFHLRQPPFGSEWGGWAAPGCPVSLLTPHDKHKPRCALPSVAVRELQIGVAVQLGSGSWLHLPLSVPARFFAGRALSRIPMVPKGFRRRSASLGK